MSKVIEERVVEMKFDNSKFESNAQTTMSTIDKLKQALKFDNASKGLEEVSQAAGNVKMDGISDACETVQAKFSALQVAAITVFSNITNEAYEAGKKIVSALTIDGAKDGFTEYELKMGSVQTIMNSTGASLDSVMGYLEELNKYADQTIYSFSDMTTNIGKFTNAGVKLEDAVAAIKGVSNEAAVSGANAQEASRAMYNFAQALSAGYVKLIDWKSIENANMATVEFKNELIKTGLALGTVVKEGELYRTTTTNAKGQTSDLFDATHAFNEALNAQWMTTEVLTQTLAKYADESTDLGKKAYAAAQEVKTFSMMMDTLKEAIGSGWAVTWEKFVGDFEHAKKMFTSITNSISDVIAKQADERNKFIGDAFNKEGLTDKNEWDKLSFSITSTGADLGQFKKILIDVARSNGVAVDELVKQYGSFEKSFASGWLTTDIFEQTVKKIQKLGDVSPEFSKLAAAVNASNKPFQELRDVVNEFAISGRTYLVDGLTNVVKALASIIAPVKEAFREIFPAKTGADLKDALQKFKEFTDTLKISKEATNNIKEASRGFFTVLKTGLSTVKDILNAFSPLAQIIKILAVNFVDATLGLGKFFNTLDDGEDSTSLFKIVLTSIHDTLQTFADNLQTYIDKAKNALGSLRDMLSESWNTGVLSIIASAVESIKNSLSGFTVGLTDGLKKLFNMMGEEIDGSGFEKLNNVLSKFAEGIKKIYEIIKNLLAPFTEKVKIFFKEMDILDAAGVSLEAGGFAAVAAVLGRFIDNILDFKEMIGNIENPVETLSNFMVSLGDLFGSIEEKVRTDVVRNFAISVGILVASMYVLASIDGVALAKSAGVLTALIGSVIGVFKALNKISVSTSTSNNKLFAFFENLGSAITGSIKAGTLLMVANAIQKIAISVLILAAAMKLISDIPLPQMAAAFTAISLLLGELTLVTKALSSSERELVKGAGSLILMATSVLILGEAMKVIASIANDQDQLTNAFLVITAMILELTLFMQVLDGNKGIKGAGTLMALSVSLLILAGAMKVIATLDPGGIAKGLISIGVLLAELALGLNLMTTALPGAAALIVAAGALLILSGALAVMSAIPLEGLGKSMLTIGVILIELAVGLTAMIAALPGAAALLVAAGAIALLVPAIMALSAAEPGKVFTAIGELAVALLAIGGVSAILGIVSPLILSFAVALGVLSIAIMGIGVGVAAAGAGLLALATSLGLLAEIGKESAERIVETLKIILNGIITMIPDMVAAFGEGIIQICEIIVKGGPTIKEALNTLVEIIVQVLEENIPRISEAFIKLLVALMEQTAEYTPQIVDSFMTLIIGILRVFNEKLPDLIQVGVDIMVSFIKGVQSAENQLINAAMEAIIAFINGLADSIERYTPQLIAAVKKLFNAIIDAMLLILFNGNPKLAKQAKELIGNFISGISSRVEEVISTIADMISKMIGKISDKVEDFKEAGKNMIQGFINGVKDKVEEAVEAVKSVGGSAIEALRKKLDEHSPSKVFYKIGDYAVAGFVNSLKDGVDEVSESSANIGEAAMESITSILSDNIDVNPVITPVLDLSEVEKGASQINDISGAWNDISVGVSADMNKAASGFNASALAKTEENQNGLDLLRSAINALNSQETGTTLNNTFNISGDDPRTIADEVSRVLQRQVERRGAVWA